MLGERPTWETERASFVDDLAQEPTEQSIKYEPMEQSIREAAQTADDNSLGE